MPDWGPVEAALRMIKGVVAARAVGDDGVIEELHVLAEGDRHPKQIARDIESCLLVQFGLAVDHRRISVAQVDAGGAAEPRLKVRAVATRLEEAEVAVEVDLSLGERLYRARRAGPFSARNRLLLAAQAALDAARQAARPPLALVADDVAFYDVGGQRVAAVLVAFSNGRTAEPLVGAAIVRRDETDACVRAALAAVNRRLAPYLV